MTENAPIWLDPGHGKYVLCSVMSVSYRSPEFSSTFHDNIIISPSGFGHWTGPRWFDEKDFAKWNWDLVCGALWWHEAWLRWPHVTRGGVTRDQMMTLSGDHVMARRDSKGERGLSLERNLFPSSQACLVCPRPGRPTWPAPLAPASGHWWTEEQLTPGTHQHTVAYLVRLVWPNIAPSML